MLASVPEVLAAWMRPFASCFTTAAGRHVLVLAAGTLLVSGRRTVAAALRVMGLDQAPGCAVYYRVLSARCWSSRAVTHRLLLGVAFVPEGPVVVGVDDSIERRWGAKITACDLYRDPVRSSRRRRRPPEDSPRSGLKGHREKASGLGSSAYAAGPALAVRHPARFTALGERRLGTALPGRAATP